MQKFERAHFEVKEYVESDNYGKFVLEPLERGFGITLGNALRRVLISSLPGAAVFSIKADGVYHEFTTIPGVREDVAMMILNIKDLVMKIDDDEIYTLKQRSQDIINSIDFHTKVVQDCEDFIKILNPEIAEKEQRDYETKQLKEEISSLKEMFSNFVKQFKQ